jgi:hypothetical protein
MDLTNWTPYLKLDTYGTKCMAQQTYEPLISPDRKVFCKNYSFPNKYQFMETEDRPLYTQEVVDWFFNNEIKWLNFFKDTEYSPEVIDIDTVNKKIFIKWYTYSCNEIMYSGRKWPKDEWKLKIKNIILDQYNKGVYKLTMYPHCHYIDDNNNMRAIDWYGCVPINDPYIEEKYMQGIIHDTAKFRLDETGNAISGKLNLEAMFKRSLGTHVLWGDENMSYIYGEIFNA